MSAPTNRRRIAIVGGGVAGLTLAVALDPRLFEVELHEAQPERITGAALGLWARARHELAGVGVALPEVHPDRRLVLHRLDGCRVLGLPAPAVAQVKRPALMKALTEAVPSSVERVHAEVADPARLDADLVVGADGVRSRVRAVVSPPDAQRQPTPWVTLRGITTDEGAGTKGTTGVAREFWGSAMLFGDAPVAGGRYWFAAYRSDLGPEPLDVDSTLEQARGRFVDAGDVVRSTLAAAGRDTLATRLWVSPPLRRYCRGRYVVIGDAAHAALPNLGRGASDAVLDAVSLARTLNSGGSLKVWEARRLPVTQAARLGAGLTMLLATGGWWGWG